VITASLASREAARRVRTDLVVTKLGWVDLSARGMGHLWLHRPSVTVVVGMIPAVRGPSAEDPDDGMTQTAKRAWQDSPGDRGETHADDLQSTEL
jgi:hypothetical protein